jgi:FixJ family two-component response regulator
VVVDDDGSMRQALARILRLAGYSASTFESAEALLESDAAAAADCLIFDVYLPGMTGMELYERLSSRTDAMPPVVFISAYEEPDLTHARASGTVAFLGKPFTGNRLLEEVAKSLRSGEPAPGDEGGS